MNCADRMKMIQMIDKMNDLPEFSKKLQLEDVSTFQGKRVQTKQKVLEVMKSC